VSTDNGRTWKLADLKYDQITEFGWRQWQFEWTPPSGGYYTVIARANDANGNTQPLTQEWNPSGYGWNVAPRINVLTNPGPPVIDIGGHSVESKTLRATCESCHGMEVITQQTLTRAQWDREITKMTNWGAQVKPDDRDTLLEFLVNQFGPRK